MPRKRSPPTSHELLVAEKVQLLEQLAASHGQERELVQRRLRQIETALRTSRWMASADLQPPN